MSLMMGKEKRAGMRTKRAMTMPNLQNDLSVLLLKMMTRKMMTRKMRRRRIKWNPAFYVIEPKTLSIID